MPRHWINFFLHLHGIGELAAGMEEQVPQDGQGEKEAPMTQPGDVLASLPMAEEAPPAGPCPASSAATGTLGRQTLNGASCRAGPTVVFLAIERVRATPPRSTDQNVNGDVDWAAQDWSDLVPRLYLVAVWRLRRLRRFLLRAEEAEDFVNDAIAKTIAGVRIWNRENCTLFQHLAGVIVSDISHAASSLDCRLRVSDQIRSENENIVWPPDLADESPSQELVEEWRSLQRRLLDYLKHIDPGMGRMAELIVLQDINATDELSRRLALAPSEVANLRKRLRRAARAYYAEIWS
jgi:hypothetical protein